ncbi:MAG: thioredoxin family protein [Pirellula sp.]
MFIRSSHLWRLLLRKIGCEPSGGSLNAILQCRINTAKSVLRVASVLLVLVLLSAPSIGREDEPLDIYGNFADAKKAALVQQRPMLVVLSADWCQWCRKLEKDLKSDEAKHSPYVAHCESGRRRGTEHC